MTKKPKEVEAESEPVEAAPVSPEVIAAQHAIMHPAPASAPAPVGVNVGGSLPVHGEEHHTLNRANHFHYRQVRRVLKSLGKTV